MRHATGLLSLSMLNLLAAFFVQLTLVSLIGPGVATDAFVAAATIPQALNGMAAAVAASVFVPLLAGERRVRQQMLTWALLLRVGGLCIGLALILGLLAPWWTSFVFPGFAPEVGALVVRLTRIHLLAMVFAISQGALVAYCQANDQFRRVEFAMLISLSLSLCGMFLLLPRYGIEAAAWTQVLAAALSLALLQPTLGGYVSAPSDDELRRVTLRIKPVAAANLYYKSEVLVDRFLLSLGSAGSMTLFGMAQQIHFAGTGVLGKVWGSTAVPLMAEQAKIGNLTALASVLRRRVVVLLLVTTATYLLLLAFGAQVLSLLFGFGKVSAEDQGALLGLLVALGGVLVFGSIGVVISGAYYAMGDTRTPNFVGMASFTLFIFAKMLCFKELGTVGLAWATSAYYATNVVVLALRLPTVLRPHAVGLEE